MIKAQIIIASILINENDITSIIVYIILFKKWKNRLVFTMHKVDANLAANVDIVMRDLTKCLS